MKKIVGSVLLLAIALTIVFPVIAFASSSAPMTAAEMKSVVGGQAPGICALIGEGLQRGCEVFGGDWATCAVGSVIFYLVCSFII
jgi:hypothetical protein